MFQLSSVQVWVNDQDEALAWWTEKIGFEVRADATVAELGDFRWLTVGPPGDTGPEIVLMAIPPEPMFTAETRGQIESLMSKGASGGLFFTTADIQADYARLTAAGVEFTQEPTEVPYGVDCGFRDPSGNHFRLAQIREGWAG
ncbi:VOC family protein [Patulibacter minatonensis]|uniref:VOC family protein n=1 Tax=Patulibacter minatonensis TaxID=298163 RepID=UPI00047DD88C|nr:VOC family protein [Patulibacter minatonensis]